MSVRIVLEKPRSLYTNLDFVAGRAILSLTSNETVTAITVKLEGESKSRLLGEAFNPYGGYPGAYRRGREPSTIETEVHKVCIQPAHVLESSLRYFPCILQLLFLLPFGEPSLLCWLARAPA